jgi:hypothetical protein
MNRVMWQFELSFDNTWGRWDMPEDAEIVHFDVHGGTPCMWALVSPELPCRRREVCICATGHIVPDGMKYVGTCQHGGLVWHLFEAL